MHANGFQIPFNPTQNINCVCFKALDLRTILYKNSDEFTCAQVTVCVSNEFCKVGNLDGGKRNLI